MADKTMDLVLLTKSAKFKEYCVAGLELSTGKWVRLVTDDEQTHGALSDEDMACKDGTVCGVLDMVTVPIKGALPGEHQPENVLIDTEKYWKKTGTKTLSEVLKLHPAESHKYLMGGKFAYQTEEWLPGYSLALLSVSDLSVYRNSQNKMKASFTFNNNSYTDISMTDPDFYSVSEKKEVGSAILVVSLPDVPYEGKFYKFIAKIFPQ